VLSLRDIRKSFAGVEVLHGVDLDAQAGEVLVLLGENGAGKSTLVRIVAGDHAPDAGTIEVAGERHDGLTPVKARAAGVRMIFQELSDAPTLSVAENIALGRLPARAGVVRWGEVRRRAVALLAELGVELHPDTPAGALTLGERQMVEIARAVGAEGRVLILDEPTAALSAAESDRLFALVDRLRARGTAIVHITHRLDEVARIGDRVQVLRDGRTVLRAAATEVTRDDLVRAMVGRETGGVRRPESRPGPEVAAAEPLLALEAAASDGAFAGVSVAARAGEVVALYGKLGSGAGEVAEAAFGLRPLDDGRLLVGGRPTRLRGPRSAIEAGIGLLPADRQAQGALPVRSVAENLTAPSWPRLAGVLGTITAGAEARAYGRWHDVLRVRSRNDPRQPIRTLSGGNQQKVLLGRWLERDVRVLVLIEPTRGVDVGARQDIYAAVRALAAEGRGVLVATSDYEEVVQFADRALVMSRGRVVEELAGDAITTERLTHAAGA
jgi:ribose transport system ATP-binding protein